MIDSVDGTLARRVGVARVLPHVDGRRLDDIVDYLNYVIVPAVFLVAAGSVSHWAWAALPVLASAYGFSQTEAKTQDDFFLGWPSYWNVVALYLWLLDISAPAGTAWVCLFTVLVFVPIKYVYPSRMPVLRRSTNALAGAWILVMSANVIWPDADTGPLPALDLPRLPRLVRDPVAVAGRAARARQPGPDAPVPASSTCRARS